MTVDGRANQRACLTPVAADQKVLSQPPSGSSADALVALTAPIATRAPPEESVDVLVVGAGPAGLAAARAAAACGASVIVLDERPHSGGQFFKPSATSHTGHTDRRSAQGQELVASTLRAGARIIQLSTVAGTHRADEVIAIIEGRQRIYHPRRLVLATGAYERPAPFNGWTLPGVMTTGAAQTLLRAYRVAPGRRVVIAGNGPLNLEFACALLDAGVTVLAVLDSAVRPTLRNWRSLLAMARCAPDLLAAGVGYLRQLRRAGVAVHWAHSVICASGAGRLQQVRYAPLASDGSVDFTTAIELTVDALCLGYGFVPSTELARALGCEHRLVDLHVGYAATVTSDNGATSVPGVFAVGDGVDLGGARVAMARGALAGLCAAEQLGFTGGAPAEKAQMRRALRRAESFQTALWSLYRAPPVRPDHFIDDTILCRCESISAGRIRSEIAQGHDSLAALKRTTRLGMGRCQGRYCASLVALMLERSGHAARSVERLFAPRWPVKPIPAGALSFEQPEWRGHRRSITPNLARPAHAEPIADTEAAVVIIGGGIMGACLAYYLSQAGEDVLVVERDDANLQASGANAGSLHVQLLSFDFGVRADAGGKPAATTLPLGPHSIQLWQQLQQECREDFELAISGGLMVADSEAGMEFLRAKAALERRYGIENEIIDAAQLRALAPTLSSRLLGAEYVRGEGKINPLRATYAVLEQARRQGARFMRGANVTAIRGREAGWEVETSRCRVRAGRIVNASGPWAREVAALVGVPIPVQCAPLQMIVTEPAPPLLEHLVAHADRHLSLKQTRHGGLVIGGAWPAAFDAARRFNLVIPRSVEGNLWVAHQVLPQLAGLHVLRAWAAMNIHIDGAPIIGELPGRRGFFNCVTSNGYTLAPVVARLSVDLMLRKQTQLDPKPFMLDRFG